MSRPLRTLETHFPVWLEPQATQPFPPTNRRFDDPPGLLALSLNITPELLIQAYPKGIFPWSAEDEPVTWWTPHPRAVLYTHQIKVRRSLRQAWRQHPWKITFNQAFDEVLTQCATCPRPGMPGTWLREDLQSSLKTLHQQGQAQSVEVWLNQALVGGLYGLSFGQMFFGESMFSQVANSSKLALVALATHLNHWGWPLIDCQVASDHLTRMGAIDMTSEQFELLLAQQTQQPPRDQQAWQINADLLEHTFNPIKLESRYA